MTSSKQKALEAIPGVRRVSLPDRPNGGIVLFYPRTDTSWAEFSPLVDLIVEKTDLLPVMLLSTALGLRREAECRERGLAFIATDAVPNQDSGHFPRLDSAWRGLVSRLPFLTPLDRLAQHDRIRHALPVALLRARAVRRSLRRDYTLFRSILETLQPSFFALPGDRELGPGPALMRAALDLEVPSMIAVPAVPSVDADSRRRAGQVRFAVDARRLPPFLNVLAARRWPEQVRTTPYGAMLFSPGWLIAVLQEAGMWSANPWCSGGGNCTWFLASGPWQREVFLDHGIAPEKIKVFGLIHHDPVHRAWVDRAAVRHDLEAKHALEPDRPLVVFAVPSFPEQDLIDWDTHLAELDRCFAALKAAGVNVVLSLHPKSSEADYRTLFGRYGLTVDERRLSAFLPSADLFVAGGSATIDWAILCGIPVLNLDYARLDTSIWADFPAVIDVKSGADFERELARVLGDPDYRAELEAQQKQGGERLARFDGKAGARWLDFVLSLRDPTRAGLVAEEVGENQPPALP